MKRTLAALSMLISLTHTAASAETTNLDGKIGVELNAVQTLEDRCQLTFLITNGLGKDLASAVYETVLFKTNGQVDRLTLFDFGALPQGRPRVRQFEVPQLQCETLGRVLFNGAHACTGEGITPEACDAGIQPSTLTNVEVLG